MTRQIILGYIPFRTDGIDLIDEDNTWSMLFCYTEQLAHKFGSIAEVLLDEFGFATALAKSVLPVPGTP
jgi:hypothetical protein